MSIGKVLRKEQREIRLIDKIINDGFLTEEQRIANANAKKEEAKQAFLLQRETEEINQDNRIFDSLN